jgi:pSer/pThr/pTyr-binding forkhead associated (FHA) protein
MTFSPFPSRKHHPSTLTLSPESAAPKSHTRVLETLFSNFDFDLEQVSNTIDPILTAQSRCEITSLYLQGIVSGSTAFLATNLNSEQTIHVTSRSSSWLIGQGSRCAITIPHEALSVCHAAISYQAGRGFFLTDLGSYSGTRLNRRALEPHQRRTLSDGDLVELGALRVEFFIEVFSPLSPSSGDETCF